MSMEDSTRRRWLLHLGGITALAGLSGADFEALAATPLPPGLYEPSLDHLTHILQPPKTSDAAPDPPRFFQGADFDLLKRLTALILGEQDDTPPVPEIAAWIDLIV